MNIKINTINGTIEKKVVHIHNVSDEHSKVIYMILENTPTQFQGYYIWRNNSIITRNKMYSLIDLENIINKISINPYFTVNGKEYKVDLLSDEEVANLLEQYDVLNEVVSYEHIISLFKGDN